MPFKERSAMSRKHEFVAIAMGEGANAVRREPAKPIIDVMRSDVIFVEPETG